jgi:hypothetical protein
MGRKTIWIGTAFLVGVLLWAAPATAGAALPGARFVYETCDSALPGGNPPPVTAHLEPAFAEVDSCASPGGWIGLAETGADTTHEPSYQEVGIVNTPGGFVEAETITAVGDIPESNVDSHVFENGFPGPIPEAVRIFHVRTEPELFNGNGGGFDTALTCATSCTPGAYVGARDIAVTEVDPKPPVLAPVTGTLLAGGVLRGHQTLAAAALDTGGGLSSLVALVNGLPAQATTAGACAVASVSNSSVYGLVAASPTPCPPALKMAWTLDTSAYPFHDGANTAQVCASDLATLGNPNTTCSPPQTVNVDNSCTESSVQGGESLSAQFAGSNGETETVGYGKPAEVTGALHDRAGEPVSGATICVKAQTLGTGEASAPIAALKTDAEGRFAYALAAGPDRELMLGYRHDSFQVARDVRYYAHVAASLEVNPPKLRNGRRVRLWGKLPQPAAAGRVVILQANVVGSRRWITFRRATTDAQGGFESGYQFHSTTRRTNYRFRAVVPRQDDYPYVEGHSKPVSVLVRPAARHHGHRRHRQGGRK